MLTFLFVVYLVVHRHLLATVQTTIGMAYGGMRGVPGLVTETSLLEYASQIHQGERAGRGVV